ncbi:hypothetical protein GCM10027592_29730 [Spirosoma flavus]
MDLNYSINGVSFKSLGIIVTSSDGVLDGLTLKPPFSVNWPDGHGEVVDLARPRYEARKIALKCYLVGASNDSFLTQLNALKAELIKPNTQRLHLDPTSNGKPLVFEVYCPSGIEIDKKWREAGKVIGEFTLNLVEPQPVKWVMRAEGGRTSTLQLSAVTPVTVYWGDGTRDTAMGPSTSLSHTYAGTTSKSYYVIVCGELERMQELFKTWLWEVWPRLL